MENSPEHYLHAELNELVQRDPTIFDFLQTGSLDGVWYWDIENPEEEWLSPRFKELFGYTDEEVPNTSAWWQENIFPEDLPVALENFEKHMADPSHPYDQVVRYRHKDGSTVWVRCRGLAIRDKAGKPIRMLGAHTDITSLKRAEKNLEATNRKLARSNHELQQFTHIVAHDFRAPMRGVQQISEWIVEDLDGKLDPKTTELLELLQSRVSKMQSLLDAMHTYARFGKSSDHPELVNTRQSIEDVIDILNISDRFDITLEGHFPHINGDKLLFKQVVLNLINNAVKHHDKQVGAIHIAATTTSRYLILQITDDGPGIAPQYHQKIFDIFQTLKPQEDLEIHGLGLALVKKAMTEADGNVSVKSNPEKARGTSFEVSWPI